MKKEKIRIDDIAAYGIMFLESRGELSLDRQSKEYPVIRDFIEYMQKTKLDKERVTSIVVGDGSEWLLRTLAYGATVLAGISVGLTTAIIVKTVFWLNGRGM